MPKTKKPAYTALLFKDRKGEWRWRIESRNGRIVATSGEGYKRLLACLQTLRKVLAAAVAIPIEKV